MIVSIIWNPSEIVCITPQPCHSHFCCWLLPIWLKMDSWAEMELMACAGLVGGKTEQSCIFPDLICQYQWYETLPKLSALHLSRATAVFVVDCCQFGPSWIFGLKWSLWSVPALLEVQRSKAVFFLTLYDSINDMKHLRNCLHHTSAVPQPFLFVDCCQFVHSWIFGLRMELMICAGLVRGTTEQICIFPDLIWYYQRY